MRTMENEDLDSFLLYIKQVLSEKEQEIQQNAKEWDWGLGFQIRIPLEFLQGNEKTASGIFWSEKRPPILLITQNQRAGITFRRLDGMSGELFQRMDMVRQTIRKVDGRTVFYDNGAIRNGAVHWLEYKSFASNERVYNLTFMFMTNEGTILGNFYCVFEDYEKWKPVVLGMLETIDTGYKEKKDEGI